MPVSVSFIKELETVDPKLRKVLLSMLEELERQREESVTKKEFNELKEIVRDLGKTVKELAEAQKRTEERLTRIEKIVEELVEAQKKTEARVNELAEAQKRTEARVNELAEAQKKTEERLTRIEKIVEKLAEAQKRTEEEIAKLARGLDATRREVGGLSRSVAYALENEAYRHLPKFLKANYGLEVIDRLIRTYIGGREINIFGKVRQEGKELFLVGDAVLKLDDFSKLKQVWEQVMVVKEEFGGDVIPIIITHFAKPEIVEKAKKANILVIQSFEWV